MTMGANPSTSRGVPVELSWQVDESLEFANDAEFDAYNAQQEASSSSWYLDTPNPHTVRRIAPHSREAIASEHHSRDSIVRVEQEIRDIKKSRLESESDSESRRHERARHQEKRNRNRNGDQTQQNTNTNAGNGTVSDDAQARRRRLPLLLRKPAAWIPNFFARK
jgi:hypothetical protein